MTSEIAPGVRRMRPDDHFMILSETDASPMHIGALVVLAVPAAEKIAFLAAIRRQFAERLSHTPLLARIVEAPDGYDSDVWADVRNCDLDYHLQHVPAEADWDDATLRRWVADCSMARLDLSRPPFRAFIFDRLPGDRCGFYLKMHHAVADGIGFQTILKILSDATPPAPPRNRDAELPSPEQWHVLADRRFAADADDAAQHGLRRKEALAALEALKNDPSTRRAKTPTLGLSAPTSTRRSYAVTTIPLDRLKALGKALDATINDVFLALAGTALRRYLIDIDDLPDTPIVVNSARSYRRPDHGAFGNRIVAQHPHIATHIADPIARLRAIQASMAVERARTHLDEAMLGAPEKPYGPRDRRAKFAARTASGGALLPGNITLSNVPGPAEALGYGGYAQIANYPVPIIGSGRFLNITSRRNGAMLDIGLMADPTKITDVDRVARYFTDAIDIYEAGAFDD